MDALHASGHNTAPIHPTPTQPFSLQHTAAHQMPGLTVPQQHSTQHTAAAAAAAGDVQEAAQNQPMHMLAHSHLPLNQPMPTLPHSTGSTPTGKQAGSTHAGSSSSSRGPVMFNLALVDRRDVVVLPAYDGLQPPAEGQQRQ
jgi:hypothetical protein